MNEMPKQISSSEFRMKYQSLTEVHEVTALGRVIGVWTPVAPTPYTVVDMDKPMKLEFRPVPKPLPRKRKK